MRNRPEGITSHGEARWTPAVEADRSARFRGPSAPVAAWRTSSGRATWIAPWVVASGLLLVAAGCGGPNRDAPPAAPASGPPSGAALSVLVIDDPALAEAIERRRGEWNAISGGTIEVRRADAGELSSVGTAAPAGKLDADVIVFPSPWLGPLAESGRIIPVRNSIISSDVFAASDVFPLVRKVETVWGGRTMAVPLGSPVLVLAYRADLLRELGQSPPVTWDQYDRLVARLADRFKSETAATDSAGPALATAEPLAAGWAGLSLLARAAAYAANPQRYSTLFDGETMAAQIARPPFVRALREMVAEIQSSGEGAQRSLSLDPAGAWKALQSGGAAMAITWPSAARDLARSNEPRGELDIALAELPGAIEVYRSEFDRWEPRPENRRRVTLLGISGRMAAVTQYSHNATSALHYVAWLSGGDSRQPPSAASPGTTLFRRSHIENTRPWTGADISPAAASDYALAVEAAMSREDWIAAPRIPGGSEYLSALDRAVRQAVTGALSPEDALREAAAAWDEITEKHGKDGQQRAYLHNLNLSEIASPEGGL